MAGRTPTTTIYRLGGGLFGPFKMFKRYSNYAGGTNGPLIMSWPAGIPESGVIRRQYLRSVDTVPTILEFTGLERPTTANGVAQYAMSGVSMIYSFDVEPDDPTEKAVHYYTMPGTRGIWKDGWKAVAVPAPLTGTGNFERDVWELYHVDQDRPEPNNLAEGEPENLQDLIQVWFDESDKNKVLPLDDRSAVEILTTERPTAEPPRDTYLYYPNTTCARSYPKPYQRNLKSVAQKQWARHLCRN